jgi:hypothetical protein
MAWTPISGTMTQYSTSTNVLASGYYLKFYQSGTTTAFNIATDSTGGTTLDKCLLDSSGYPTTDGSTRFIPHVNQKYKVALYKNATDADNNTTGSADWIIDSVPQYQTTGTAGGTVANLTDLKALTGQADNESINVLGHTTEGDGGGGVFWFDSSSSATDDDGTIIQPDAGGGRWLRLYEGAVYLQWFGVDDTGATVETSTVNTIFTDHAHVAVNGGTYQGEFVIPSDKTVTMIGNPTFLLDATVTATQKKALLISGDDVNIEGSFTVDGNAANVSGGSASAVTGVFQITGSRVYINGDVYIKDAYEASFAVWNGSSLTTGSGPVDVHINGNIQATDSEGHTAYIWQVDGFSCNAIKSISHDGSIADGRVRIGSQSGSTKAEAVTIQQVIDCALVFETNSYDCYVGYNNNSGTKFDNCQNIRLGLFHVDGASVSNGNNILGVGCELSSPVTKGIKIEQVIIENCEMTSSSTVVMNVSGTAATPEDIHFDTVLITNCGDTAAADVRVRDVTNMRIDHMVLDNDGGAARGLLVESGYTRSNFSIGRLESTGHATNDIEDPEGECEIESFNNVTAVRNGDVYQRQMKTFSEDITVTIGSGANFSTLEDGFRYASEMRPTYNPSTNDQPTLTLQIQSGYSLTDNITLDGGDYSHVRVTVASGTITCNTTGTIFNVTNGAVGPKVTGTYDKNNQAGIFALTTDGGFINVSGIVMTNVADECLYTARATIVAQNANITKHASAVAADTAATALGGTIEAAGATLPYVTIDSGGIVKIDGGTATGGTSETVNTLTAQGIIFQ